MFFISKEKKEQQLMDTLKETNVEEWIADEIPFRNWRNEDYECIPRIGTALNVYLRRNSYKQEAYENDKDIFDRIQSETKLKHSLTVYRGMDSIDYEKNLAADKGYKNALYFGNAFVYCSIIKSRFFRGCKYRLIVEIPAGTGYIFTGENSNDPNIAEIILPRHTMIRIQKVKNINGHRYIWGVMICI